MKLDNESKHDLRAALRTIELFHQSLSEAFDLKGSYSKEHLLAVQNAMELIQKYMKEVVE